MIQALDLPTVVHLLDLMPVFQDLAPVDAVTVVPDMVAWVWNSEKVVFAYALDLILFRVE